MVFIVIGLLLFPDSPYARYGFLAAGIIFITASMVISFRKRKN
jgi:LPXTG-motif cell wall-anchored protein